MSSFQMSPGFLAQCFPDLRDYVLRVAGELDTIPPERRVILERIATSIRDERAQQRIPRLTWICTHNSRRSHFAQVWAEVAAQACGLEPIASYSGGTESTSCNPRTVAALQRCGFRITTADGPRENPRYSLAWSDGRPPIVCFSKRYDDPINPQQGFLAVMTCSEADQACPAVSGATRRVSLPYEDPKLGDDTDQETAGYDHRSRQICREMLALMSMVEGQRRTHGPRG